MTKILRLSFGLPIIVEIVDTQKHIDEFLRILDELMPTEIVTLERVAVMRYGPSERRPQSGKARIENNPRALRSTAPKFES